MSATFTPYLEAQAHRDPTDSVAYIRVRVPDGPRPDGSILVYLPNGTGLVVNSDQLLHLDKGPDCAGEPDSRGVLQARHQLPLGATAGWAER
jgi:hypothetical protein